eukprot:m.187159 g.187159  ORF g.187159 m.187159 type:complete len:66 (+) comp18153_c0_seq2:159-356(+)
MSTTGTPRSTDGTSTQGGTPLVLLARIDDVRDVGKTAEGWSKGGARVETSALVTALLQSSLETKS